MTGRVKFSVVERANVARWRWRKRRDRWSATCIRCGVTHIWPRSAVRWVVDATRLTDELTREHADCRSPP